MIQDTEDLEDKDFHQVDSVSCLKVEAELKNLVLKYFCEDNDGQTAWTGTTVYFDAQQPNTI